MTYIEESTEGWHEDEELSKRSNLTVLIGVIMRLLIPALMRDNYRIIVCSYAAQGYGVASLAEGTTVPLMQCPLLVRTGIRN